MGELFSSTDKVDMTGWTEYPISYHLDYRSEMVWQVRKSIKNFIKSGDFDNLADVFRVVWFYVEERMFKQNTAINFVVNSMTKDEKWRLDYMKKTRADEFEKTIIEYLEANDIEVTAENVAYFKEKLNRRLNFKRR